MTSSYGSSMNELESRLARLENRRIVKSQGPSNVSFNSDVVGTSDRDDLLDWDYSDGWEPYTKITPSNPVDGSGAAFTSKYAMPEAHMVGRTCVLTGMVRRQTGATNLSAGVPVNSFMFGLPTNWRPVTNVILPCLMGNSDPVTGGVVGTAQIEIRTGYLPTEISGRVYYIAGTSALTANIGWISLQGSFPCQIVDVLDVNVMGSWDDAHFQETWDMLPGTHPDGDWDSYGDPFNYQP